MRGVFSALNVPFRASHGSLRLPASEVLLKERQAALNWLLPREVYDTFDELVAAGWRVD